MTVPALEASLRRASAVQGLVQGEVLPLQDACVVLADASAPLSNAAAAAATGAGLSSGLVYVPQDNVENVVLLTQTCDLQETNAGEFLCLVAPVIQVSEKVAYEALRGRRPPLVGLPWVDSTSVGDLTRITAVERSLVVGLTSLGRPRSPAARQHLGDLIGRFLSRPALPDHVSQVLRPMGELIQKRHDKHSPEGACWRLVTELRVEASPDLDAADLALNVLVVVSEVELPALRPEVRVSNSHVDELIAAGVDAAAKAVHAAQDGLAKRESWTALAECWVAAIQDGVADVPGIDALEITVLSDEELSYARSRNAPLLDLRYLTTRAA